MTQLSVYSQLVIPSQATIRYLPVGILLTVTAIFAGCGGETDEAPVFPAGAVAIWDGGQSTLADLESAYGRSRSRLCFEARRSGRVDDLVPCYRQLAEDQAIQRLVLAEHGHSEVALAEMEDYEILRRQSYLEAWLAQTRTEITVGDDEIEARFEAERESFRRPGTVNLANIFRRHDDVRQPQVTLDFLRGLKERFEAGEAFDALARAYSHSETRARGGHVGQVTADRLPDRLRRAVFTLEEGEVSDPIRVRDGAVLLYVQSMSEPEEPSLIGQRERLRGELTAERIDSALASRIAGLEVPAESLVLPLDALVSALDSDEAEKPVLDMAGDRLTVDEFRILVGLGERRVAELDAFERDDIAKVYERERAKRLLAFVLATSEDAELREEAESHFNRGATALFVDEQLREDLEELVTAEDLEGWFTDNRHHYQSPLRFSLRVWNLPFGDDPPAQLRRMEDLHERLTAGEIDLEAAADELGGRIEDFGWRQLEELPEAIPDKARAYLIELGDQGFSVPYQKSEALHIVELVKREEPRPLEYAEAADEVRADYLARFQQQLYRRVARQRLDDVDFAFDENAVRRLLVPAEETPPEPEAPPVATFSVLGFDPETGEVGGAVQSRVFSVGNGVLWAEANIGVVATQAIVDVSYGPQALELLRQGVAPKDVIRKVLAADPDPRPDMWTVEGRQFAVMDASGRYAAHTGPKASIWAGHQGGKFVTAQGNILAGEAVVDAMVAAFEKTQGHLSLRLLAALEAGQKAGGDTRGMQSAAMLIVKEDGGPWLNNDVVLRLQVDDNSEPIRELRRLVEKNQEWLRRATLPPAPPKKAADN